MLDILVISPHPDDAEIYCGGALIISKEKGYKTGILYMTKGEMGTGGTEYIRKAEVQEASKVLDLDYYKILEFKDCNVYDSFENRLELARYIRILKPKILLLPYWEGVPGRWQGHTDHIATSILSSHAVNFARLKKMPISEEVHKVEQVLYYLFPQTINPTFLIDISNVADKWKKSVEAHKSQVFEKSGEKTRFYDMIISYHKTLGFHIDTKYAQGFLSKTPIKLSSISSLFNI